MRVDVVVEYDGPSLSDTSSIASFPSENSWNSQGSRLTYDDSGRDGRRQSYASGGSGSGSSASRRRGGDTRSIVSGLTDLEIASDSSGLTGGASSGGGGGFGIRSKALGLGHNRNNNHLSHRLLRPDRSYATPAEPYHYDGPPSLLTNSELGSRWLREQSQLAHRIPRVRVGVRQYDSDESLSDEESLGDIALVRDARGRELEDAAITDIRLLLFVPDGNIVHLVPLRWRL
jgi:hypothetical protein